MNMFIDAHSHLDRYGLIGKETLESALAEIVRHRIFTISNSMDLPSYQRNLDIERNCHWVLPAFGVHPWRAAEYVDRLPDLSKAIEDSPLIGEIGLDHYFVDEAAPYPDQRKVFEYFMGAAREQRKLVTLHTKGAEREVLELLERYELARVIVHWYSGAMDIFKELVVRGAYFTVGVEVLYSKHVQTIAQELPAGQLLTETDNPGGLQAFTGEYGMPVLVKDIVRGIARARQTTDEAIIETVQANWLGLIRDDPWLADSRGKVWSE